MRMWPFNANTNPDGVAATQLSSVAADGMRRNV